MRVPWDSWLCGSGAGLLAPAPKLDSDHCCQAGAEGFSSQFQFQGQSAALIKSRASVSIFGHMHESLAVFQALALPGPTGSAFHYLPSSSRPPYIHLFISPFFLFTCSVIPLSTMLPSISLLIHFFNTHWSLHQWIRHGYCLWGDGQTVQCIGDVW